MFQVSAGVLGALAVVLPLGAMQLTSGGDLVASSDTWAAVVNRALKSDRGTVRLSHIAGRTVSVRLESLPDASIVIQIPGSDHLVAGGDLVAKPRPRRAPTSQAKRTIACEPVVSVLTEIAKQLQPGRCVT
jgi:hypothetical protein